MREPYSFDVFAADGDKRSVNFGVMFTYRQRWAPQVYQAGPLVRTVTLAPREERSFTIRQSTKKEQATDLRLSSPARQIAAGGWHTCALLEDDTVRCWGSSERGQLGYGSTETLWDAASAPPVPL